MNKRKDMFIAISITYFLILLAVISYMLWLKNYVEIPECIIHKYTGLYCPACGGTRAVLSLASGNIIQSFLYNPIVLYSFIFSTIYLVVETINFLLKKDIEFPWKMIIKIGLIILTINCIIKNVII